MSDYNQYNETPDKDWLKSINAALLGFSKLIKDVRESVTEKSKKIYEKLNETIRPLVENGVEASSKFFYNLASDGYSYLKTRRDVPSNVEDSIKEAQKQEGIKKAKEAAEALIEQQITLEVWQESMREIIKTQHLKQTMLAVGGDALSTSDLERLENTLKEEYSYLKNFTEEIKAGKVSPAQVESRSKMYVNKSRASYESAKASIKKSEISESVQQITKAIKGDKQRNTVIAVVAGVLLITAAGVVIAASSPVSVPVTAGGLAATSGGALVVTQTGAIATSSTAGALAVITSTGALVQADTLFTTGTTITSAAIVLSQKGPIMLATKGAIQVSTVTGGALVLTGAGLLAKRALDILEATVLNSVTYSFNNLLPFKKKRKKMMQRFLGNTDRHCAECLSYAAKGPRPVGDLPLPTEECSCRANCLCRVKYFYVDEEGAEVNAEAELAGNLALTGAVAATSIAAGGAGLPQLPPGSVTALPPGI
jgi:hypothetical protein